MLTIIFETQGQTFDDETGVVSGWNDVRLSQLGMDQAKQLGERYTASLPDAIFASDLKRAEQTLSIAFDPNPNRIFLDWRLRECQYGDAAGMSLEEHKADMLQKLNVPYTNGESYVQSVARVASFLKDIHQYWDGKTVLLVGDWTTYLALEFIAKGVSPEVTLQAEWIWQPGWQYQLI